jgi:transcription termination factor Rho
MVTERNDINANQILQKEINLIERKQLNNQNNNINSKRTSSVSVSRLNVNYLKETASSSSNNSATYIINTNNSLFNNNTTANNSSNNNREKTFSFGKMNKSINNANSITSLNEKNSPFQFIKAQLAYKHYEILYKPKSFRAGILPVEENSDYTNIQ